MLRDMFRLTKQSVIASRLSDHVETNAVRCSVT